ncbi:MAG: response regulator [Rubrivivax sp.]|nr:response regulator [Rubrivivax sp.]
MPSVFRTLRSQYLLASLAVFVAMLGLLLWNAQVQMQRTLQERFDGERDALAPLLVAALGPLLAARDYATIAEVVRGNVASGGNLAFLELTDARGRLVAAAGPEPRPGQRVASVPVRLADQTLGQVRFTLRTSTLAAAQRQLSTNSLAIGGGVLVAGMLLLVLAMGWLTREFRGLSRASRRIAEGDYGTRLPASRVREIDEVASAFNRMAQAVATQLRELREQQRFTRSVLDTLAEGYLIVDRDNRVLDCNDTFLRLHGLDRPAPGQVFDVNRAGAQLFLPDGQPMRPQDRATVAVLASGQPQRDRLLRIRRADGAESWVSVNATPLVRDGETEPYAAMATLTDVTRHVEAERELRSANESLEQRVLERTAELARAKEEAERASRTKSEFLSRMSHELRTPLNAILGFAQVMAMDGTRLAADDLARLRQIETAGWHLLALINDVLDLSRIEAGVMTTSAEPVELHALVAESLALVQVQAGERRIALVPPPGEPGGSWVTADRRRLKQVLANLLSNAVKYNRDGGRVEVRIAPPAQGRRALAVVDTGRGFEPEHLQRLFEPFTRFLRDDETIEGTGIGLVITRRLVELMGGRLEVHSQAGVGSEFRVLLPVAEAPDLGTATAPVRPTVAPFAPSVPATRRRLLYVEDNPSNVELLRQVVLLRPAWALEVAGDGLSGLQRLLDESFDGAIVDIDLPGLDGVALCRRVRAEPAIARLPLLALSANAMPADVRRALAAGFDGYVTKPVDVPTLLQRLDRLLGVVADA